jgi:hypothetical protein
MRIFFILPFICIALCTSQSRESFTSAGLKLLYDSLQTPVTDETNTIQVSNFSFVRGGQTILLSSGTLRPFRKVGGREFGAVFSGKGFLTVHPLTDVEQNEFRRQTDLGLTNGMYTYEFQRCVFLYTDTGFVLPNGPATTVPMKAIEQRAIDRSLKYAQVPYDQNTFYRILREIVDPAPRPYLWCHFLLDDGGNDFFLEHDPRRFEEVVLSHPYLGTSTGFNFIRSTLCSFHLPEEYATTGEYDLSSEDKQCITVDTVRTFVQFGHSPELKGHAFLHLQPKKSWPRALSFFLVNNLTLRSITTADGRPVPFCREEKASEIFALLPPADSSGSTFEFQYDGDFFRLAPIYTMASFTNWYPTVKGLNRMNFDMTFTYPADLKLFAGGKIMRDTIVGSERQVQYVTEKPCIINSFIVGEFNPITTQLSDTDISVTALGFNSNDQKNVATTLGLIVRYFSHKIGYFPSKKLCVAPGIYGQAYPDFIRIPTEYPGRHRKDEDHFFEQAHEVAHSYWGHSVGWKSYHDQWLSEGLATYYGLLFAGIARQNDDVSDILKTWRESLTNLRKYAFGSGPPVGSIWLGYRASAYKTGEDYFLLDYYKGAWVVHMLRMLMIDMKSWKEDRFNEAMKDFYNSFKGKDPSTEDFRVVFERHAGGDLRWFFDQWVYRWEIPKYRWSKSITRNSQGTWSLKINVEESGVPETFIMPVMIEIKLQTGTTLHGRLVVDKPAKDFTFDLASEPVSVVFNSNESVLCTVEE